MIGYKSLVEILFFNTVFFIKSLFSIFLGAIIGYERETRKKPAGIKTHAILAMATCALTHLSLTLADAGDPTRIAAQIISGVGFIGAGTIFMNRQKVQGLTSAATVFFAATIGMLSGAEQFTEAIILVSFLIIISYILKPKEGNQTQFAYKIEAQDWETVDQIQSLIKQLDIKQLSFELEKKTHIVIYLKYEAHPMLHQLFSKHLFETIGIIHISHQKQ